MGLWSTVIGAGMKSAGNINQAVGTALKPTAGMTDYDRQRLQELLGLQKAGQGLTDQEKAVLSANLLSPQQAIQSESRQRLGQSLAMTGGSTSDALRGVLGLAKQQTATAADAARSIAAQDIAAQQRNRAELSGLSEEKQAEEIAKKSKYIDLATNLIGAGMQGAADVGGAISQNAAVEQALKAQQEKDKLLAEQNMKAGQPAYVNTATYTWKY